MSVKINTEGAQLKLIQRIQCITERANSLQSDLDALQEIREECCESNVDGITMGGTFVTLDGENVTMNDE